MKFGLASRVFFAVWLSFYSERPSSAAEQDLAKLFGTLPDFGAASISPSGKAIAFETPIDGVRSIVLLPLEQGGSGWRFTIADRFAYRLVWRDDTQLLATLRGSLKGIRGAVFGQYNADGFYPFYQNALLTGRSNNPVQRLNIFPFGSYGPSSVLTELNSNDPDSIFFSTIVRRNDLVLSTDLYRVRLQSEQVILVQQGDPETAQWFMDGSGNILARLDITRAGEDVVLVPEGRNFKKIATLGSAEGRVVGLTEDGKALAVLGRRGGTRLGLHRLNLADGKFGDPLFVNSGSDVRRVLFDERSFRVMGVTYDEGSLRIAYLAPERQRLQKQIEDVLPGRTVNVVSKSADGTKVAVVTSSPQNPPLLHLANLKTNRIDVYAEAYPLLSGTHFGEVRRHAYAARDGSTLIGLLTLPPQRQDKNLPIVALPAGGFGYSIDAFDWFAQFLAQRGYAVFQAGARNLKELGDVTDMDDFGSWMNASQDDIAKGVDDLVAKGIADPKRICIAGSDTGGYVALSATIFVPGKYACAINFAGLSDLRLLMRNAWGAARAAQNVFYSMLLRNRHEYSDEDLHDFSPARRANAVAGAVLLIFPDRGRAQGDKMNEALIGAHKPVEYLTLKDEDGTLSRTESRVALLNAVDKFLAAHIGE